MSVITDLCIYLSAGQWDGGKTNCLFQSHWLEEIYWTNVVFQTEIRDVFMSYFINFRLQRPWKPESSRWHGESDHSLQILIWSLHKFKQLSVEIPECVSVEQMDLKRKNTQVQVCVVESSWIDPLNKMEIHLLREVTHKNKSKCECWPLGYVHSTYWRRPNALFLPLNV